MKNKLFVLGFLAGIIFSASMASAEWEIVDEIEEITLMNFSYQDNKECFSIECSFIPGWIGKKTSVEGSGIYFKSFSFRQHNIPASYKLTKEGYGVFFMSGDGQNQIGTVEFSTKIKNGLSKRVDSIRAYSYCVRDNRGEQTLILRDENGAPIQIFDLASVCPSRSWAPSFHEFKISVDQSKIKSISFVTTDHVKNGLGNSISLYKVWLVDEEGNELNKIKIWRGKLKIIEILHEDNLPELSNTEYSIKMQYDSNKIVNITGVFLSRLKPQKGENYDFIDRGKQDTYMKDNKYITLSKKIKLPLISSNNSKYEYKWKLNITFKNLTLESILHNKNELTDKKEQNIILSVWIESILIDRENHLEMENSAIRLNVRGRTEAFNLSSSFKIIYNSSYSDSRKVLEFSRALNGIFFEEVFNTLEITRGENETRKVIGSLTVEHGGKNRTMSMNKNFQAHKMILTDCSGPLTDTEAVKLFLWDEENITMPVTGNIEILNEVNSNSGFTRKYPFTFSDVNNTSLCIFPDFASFKINSFIQYHSGKYSTRNYRAKAVISKNTKTINLFLLDQSTSLPIIFFVRDENGNSKKDLTVKIQRFYWGKNAYKTVAMCKTDSSGKCTTFLRILDTYYRFIVEDPKTGAVIRQTEPRTILCSPFGSITSCPPYPVLLLTGDLKYSIFSATAGKVGKKCVLNEVTNVISCTITDTTNMMAQSNFIVEKVGALKSDQICNSTSVDSAVTYVCNLGNRSGNIYKYTLTGKFDGSERILENKILDFKKGPIDYGMMGLFLGLIIIASLFFAGIYNPIVSITLAIVGIIAGMMLNLIPISVPSLIGLIIALGMIIWKMKRGD